MDSGKLDFYPFLSRKPREVGSDSVTFSVLYGTGHLCVYGKNQAGGYWQIPPNLVVRRLRRVSIAARGEDL